MCCDICYDLVNVDYAKLKTKILHIFTLTTTVGDAEVVAAACLLQNK